MTTINILGWTAAMLILGLVLTYLWLADTTRHQARIHTAWNTITNTPWLIIAAITIPTGWTIAAIHTILHTPYATTINHRRNYRGRHHLATA